MIYGPPPTPPSQLALNESFIALGEPLSCPSHNFDIHIFSREPLIIYITSFLSPEESQHLLAISEDKFEPSTVSSGDKVATDPSVRLSEVALVDRDATVKCIEDRARTFQGWRPHLFIERLRTQRYGESGHYVHHYDWSGGRRGADRVSTFMVYVDVNCTGGGTEFPRLRKPASRKWCEFIECDDDHDDDEGRSDGGVTFKPIKGNAIFWENLRPDGHGYAETWHAGLPVLSGTKVGLNIWSWYQPQ
ncbi:hypothetical protein MMC08_008196 [Hypocenomyce scalaris]|nr:hypothetical protein [Hypocenomyce scalaris]